MKLSRATHEDPNRETWRLRAYRAGMRILGNPRGPLMKRVFSESRRLSPASLEQGFTTEPTQVPRIWFHAASEGELEALWEVVLAWGRAGAELVVTVFSESAGRRVRGLAAEIEELSKADPERTRLLFAGYSPWEGRWRTALERVRPDGFVTVKYEAWPELWCSLSALGIPLVVLDARARSSLRNIRRLSGWLGMKLPRLALGVSLAREARPLTEIFPGARVERTGAARWERVFLRAEKGNARARDLMKALRRLPRPWGVIGSAWPPDLTLWGEHLAQARGTIWIVPHQVDEASVSAIEAPLKRVFGETASFLRTRRAEDMNGLLEDVSRENLRIVIVDEMGFLAELYSGADWAQVGGGFSGGVHSTIEPAIHGIPIFCGPKNVEKFSETIELLETGQLEVVQDSASLLMWIERFVPSVLDSSRPEGVGVWRREEWRTKARARRGAVEASCALVREMIGSRA